MTKTKAKKETMVDIIDYLGGQPSKAPVRTVSLNQQPLDASSQQQGYYVDIKLEGGAPGKLLSDKKAKLFMDRLEYYIRHPEDVVV
jgi:hypothetical protein